jgi:hypothetical protein
MHLVGFTIEIYQDPRSHKRQIHKLGSTETSVNHLQIDLCHKEFMVRANFELEQATRAQRKSRCTVLWKREGVSLDGESHASAILTLERDQVFVAQWARWAFGQLWGNSASLKFNPRTIQPVACCYTD